jgi:error-prone DNA polymerase
MGLRYVKGMAEADGQRLVAERGRAPFRSLAEFRERVPLDSRTLAALAEAGAFEGFGLKRREALWAVRGQPPAGATQLRSMAQPGSAAQPGNTAQPGSAAQPGNTAQPSRPADGVLPLPDTEPRPAFVPLRRAQAVHWDYRAAAHSVRGHPMAQYRAELHAAGVPDARAVNRLPDGRRVRYAGVVINRQRPGTAKGVVFMTLEDETGFVNLVLWESVFERFPVLARTALLLGVTGKLQAQDGVVHLVAEELWEPALSGTPALLKSRDFH